MKAFLLGLAFLIAAILLTGAGILLFPLIVALTFFLRIVIALLSVIFAIWLLGKLIIFIWEKLK